MLIRLTVENFKSFDQREELSMISSAKIQGNKNHKVKIKQTNILKNAVVYGANASGKSNLVTVFAFIKATLAEGLPVNSFGFFSRNKEENKTRESVFELQLALGESFYAYGFSAILSQRKITGEWMYELLKGGGSRNLFSRESDDVPKLGDDVHLDASVKTRFSVYAEDFAGHDNDARLFLSEMNNGKKYEANSKLLFFKQVFGWIMNNIIILNPNIGISNSETYNSQESLENISNLIKTFDTGISQIKTKTISMEELSKTIPPELFSSLVVELKKQLAMSRASQIQMTWRIADGFFNIKISGAEEPEITTLVLKHGKSMFDFDFSEESDGTKRLFDLIDMLLTKRDDLLFVVDELERSLHPKLTEHFLELFMEAHDDNKVQIICTTHEDSIMDQELFRRDEIWFVERNSENASSIYSLDRFKERYDKKLSKAYLEGRYGAIPVFKKFSFKKEE